MRFLLIVLCSMLTLIVMSCAENEESVQDLAKRLSRKSDRSARSAMERLIEIGDPAVEYLDKEFEDLDEIAQARAIHVFKKVGSKKAARALIKRLYLNRKNYNMRLVSILVGMGESIVPELTAELDNPNPEIRAHLVAVLASIGGEGPLEALLSLSRDEKDPVVKNQLAGSFGAFKDERVVDYLVGEAASGDLVVSLNAIRSLGHIGNAKCVETLTRIMEDEGNMLLKRIYAAGSLAKLGNENAKALLLECLTEKNPEIVINAARYLGRTNDPSLFDALSRLLDHKHVEVRRTAAIALGRVDGSKATPLLIRLLDDAESRAREGAASALREIGTDEAMEALKQLLRHEKDPYVRRAAGEAYNPRNVKPRFIEY